LALRQEGEWGMKTHIYAYVAIAIWAVAGVLVLLYAPRTNNPTDCQELAQPEQAKCKARRRL
jgi:hypothetical protein